jgi:hypothetical protein
LEQRGGRLVHIHREQIRIKNVTNQTAKFDCVVNSLPEEMKGQILDIIEAAPAANPYDFLK